MVCQASALGTVWSPSNMPPSTTVLRHFLLHAHIVFMSLLTQFFDVFLGAPLPTTPVTFILVQIFTKSFIPFRSTCPNHLNLALWILFSTHSMPKRLNCSSLRFLSFKDNPHILRNIILSALPNLSRSSVFISHVSLQYTNTLWIQAYIFFPSVSNGHPFLSKLVLAH